MPKILIVDDELGWRDLFAWELSSKGYAVAVADNGLEAVKKFERETFDLMIMDVMMPGMDGVEAFLTIKKSHPDVKVILMTGTALERRLQKALISNAYVCIRKPFDLALMVQTIQQTLETPS